MFAVQIVQFVRIVSFVRLFNWLSFRVKRRDCCHLHLKTNQRYSTGESIVLIAEKGKDHDYLFEQQLFVKLIYIVRFAPYFR